MLDEHQQIMQISLRASEELKNTSKDNRATTSLSNEESVALNKSLLELKYNSFEIYSEIIIEITSLLNPEVIIITSGGYTRSWENDPASCVQSYPIYARDLVGYGKEVVIINIDPNYKYKNFYVQPTSNLNIFNITGYDFCSQSLYPAIKEWLNDSNSKKVVFHSHNVITQTPLSTKLASSLFDDPTIDHNNIEIITGYFSHAKRNFILTDKTQTHLSSVKESNYKECIRALDLKLTAPFFGTTMGQEPSAEDLAKITLELHDIGWSVCPEDSLLHMTDVPILGSIASIEALCEDLSHL